MDYRVVSLLALVLLCWEITAGKFYFLVFNLHHVNCCFCSSAAHDVRARLVFVFESWSSREQIWIKKGTVTHFPTPYNQGLASQICSSRRYFTLVTGEVYSFLKCGKSALICQKLSKSWQIKSFECAQNKSSWITSCILMVFYCSEKSLRQ